MPLRKTIDVMATSKKSPRIWIISPAQIINSIADLLYSYHQKTEDTVGWKKYGYNGKPWGGTLLSLESIGYIRSKRYGL